MTIATPTHPTKDYADGYQRGEADFLIGLPITEGPKGTNPSGMPDDEHRGWRAGWLNTREAQVPHTVARTAHANLRAQVAAEIEHAATLQPKPAPQFGGIYHPQGQRGTIVRIANLEPYADILVPPGADIGKVMHVLLNLLNTHGEEG